MKQGTERGTVSVPRAILSYPWEVTVELYTRDWQNVMRLIRSTGLQKWISKHLQLYKDSMDPTEGQRGHLSGSQDYLGRRRELTSVCCPLTFTCALC